MDKEEARFILRCFRPDGADAENPDFAEALAWAAKDRELGEWLAHERASDAGFATALNAVSIPASLREEILTGLAAERGDVSSTPEDVFDRSVMGAMASIHPPRSLRAEILAAMDRTAAGKKTARRWPWRFILPAVAAAAAAITVVVLTLGPADDSAKPIAKYQPPSVVPLNPDATPEEKNDDPGSALVPISINRVEDGAIKVFEEPGGFKLDLTNEDHHALFQHLKEAKLPCPNACLPPGLQGAPGVGCRKLEIAGKQGALVCFKEEGDVVHLVAFKRCDVSCKVPKKGEGEPDIGRHGNWSVARWEDEDWVFVLMSGDQVEPDRLKKLFGTCHQPGAEKSGE